MKLTSKIEKAIRIASLLHDGQKRKGEEQASYISHPFSVACMVSQYTDDEDTIIAALLHDTVEDTPYTFADMERDFGDRIADIVRGVTEEKARDGEPIPWKERKEQYIERLKSAPEASLLVSAADKLHNLQSLMREWEHRERLFSTTSKGVSADDYAWFYDGVIAVLRERLLSPLVTELERCFDLAKKRF